MLPIIHDWCYLSVSFYLERLHFLLPGGKHIKGSGWQRRPCWSRRAESYSWEDSVEYSAVKRRQEAKLEAFAIVPVNGDEILNQGSVGEGDRRRQISS